MIINPSSLRKVSLAILKEQSFYDRNISYIPFLNVYNTQITPNRVKVMVPYFDFFSKTNHQTMLNFASKKQNYNFGLIESLTIDAIDLYKPINTYTYSQFLSSTQNETIKTKGNMKFSVILPYAVGEPNSLFLEAIWRLAVYNFVPFFLNTDVSPKNLGGPLFVNEFNISLNNGSIDCNLSFEGGVRVKPPATYGDSNLIGLGERRVYRTARNIDCLITIDVNEDLPTVGISSNKVLSGYSAITQSLVIQGINILDMKLGIKNDLKSQFTANDGITKKVTDGPKSIAYGNRSVDGSITFISSTDLSTYFSAGLNKSLTMYFGGPFYFPMKNVTIQSFGLSLSADTGYFTHTVKFIALLQPSQFKEFYKQNEFDINYDGLLTNLTGAIYTEPQPEAPKDFEDA